MKKLLSNIWLLAAALFLLAVSCEKPVEQTVAPYLDAVPEAYAETALGEGDGFLISVRSNVPWTLSAVDAGGNPVDWIRFDATSGNGDADILGIVLRGDRETDRSCTIVLRSEDGKLEKTFVMKQGLFVPVMLNLQLADVLKTGYPLAPGATEDLTDFGLFDAEVVGVPGGNLPEGYVYLTDDGSCYIRAAAPNVASLKVGDKVKVEMTAGTVTKEMNGGYTANLSEPITVVSSGAPSVEPAYISSDALSHYENAFVELRDVQAPQGSAGKAWSGDVSLIATDEKDASFPVHVESGASFGSVGAGSGAVRGIVVDGKVRPRSAEDVSGLTGERIPAYKAPFQIAPVANFLHIGGAANTVSNGTISGATKLTFQDDPGYSVAGAAIEKVVGGANKMSMVIAVATPWQSCFTTIQWALDNTYLLYTVPVTQKIYGDLEFAFSLSCGTANMFPGNWTVSWSTDGTNFKPADAVYCTTSFTEDSAAGSTFTFTQTGYANNRQLIEFSIPESEAVTSGNIYFKMVPPKVAAGNATKTLRVNNGSVLSSRTTNTPNKGYHNVLAMENFERCLYAHNPVVGVPTYYLSHFGAAPAYSNMEGWAVSGTSLVNRGCLRLSAASGANFIMSPVLDMLKAPTDLTLTFKVSPYVNATGAQLVVNANAIAVDLTGSGSVGQIEWDSAYEPYKWATATVKITGASSDTQIQIGNLDASAANAQFYIDDIIIKR